MDVIRVFCGSEPKTRVAELVLEYSIRRRTQAEVEFLVMGEADPWLIPSDVHQATGFSLRRWLIPEYCGFSGKAIYLDADQLVLGDIADLWAYADGGAAIHCTYRPDKCSQMLTGIKGNPVPQTSVMVLECDRCNPEQWCRSAIFSHIRAAGKPRSGKKVVKAYQYVMHGGLAGALDGHNVKEIPQRWNSFNEMDDSTKLLHYTFEDTQPWYNPKHPHARLWEEELAGAIADGFVCRADLDDALERGRGGSRDWRRFGGMHPYWEKMLEHC